MDFRVGIVFWFAALYLQFQICSAESPSNCSSNYGEGGADGGANKVGDTTPGCGDEQSANSGNYQRLTRTVADNRLPGVDGMRSMQRLPWIGGDIQKFAADLHDAKTRADAERQPSEEFHKVAESLMELLVRISENPDHWRIMTKNILQARLAGVLPPEDKKSSADNRSDGPPPRPGVARTPDGRRRRLGFGLNKKKKPRQKGQGQKDQKGQKDADANRTDVKATGRPLSEQEARRQRLRQLAEAGVLVPTAPAPARAGGGGGRGGGRGRPGGGGGGGKGRRPKVQPPATTALPPRENQLLKQDWRNFQQQKMMWKHVRPSPAPAPAPVPEEHPPSKVLTPIYGRYPSTTMNAGGGGGGQKFGTLTRHAPDGPTAMTPLDKVRKMPDGPKAGEGGGGGGGGWDNATLSALRHGASLSRDEMVQRLLQNRPLPAELDLLSRQLGRVNKSAPEDEFGRWKQQMERLRSGPRVAVAPTPPPPPPPPAQPPQRFRPYALLTGDRPPPAAAPAAWATDRAGQRVPAFDYHRQPPAGKGPFASITVPSSTDQLRGEEFPTGRLVRMRDPLEQQLVDMATSAERQSLLRRRPLPVWGRSAGLGALQADPGPLQERFMTLSDVAQQLRYHTQQTNRLRKILNAAAPRRA